MLNLKNKGYHCWVVNKTNMKICLSDIFITLPPNSTTDLLDYRHSPLTVEQVEKSIESGCLKNMFSRGAIAYRINKPEVYANRTIDISKLTIPKAPRTGVKIEEKKFTELDLDLNPDAFATENSDQVIAEHSPKINMREQSNNLEYIAEGDDKKR